MKRLLLALLVLMSGCAQRSAGSHLVQSFADKTRVCTDDFQRDLKVLQRRVHTDTGARDGIGRAMNQYGTCMDKVSEEFGL